ncbi:MAG: hypothetical protein ACLPR9_02720 [Acidimicrobiales bacterium]
MDHRINASARAVTRWIPCSETSSLRISNCDPILFQILPGDLVSGISPEDDDPGNHEADARNGKDVALPPMEDLAVEVRNDLFASQLVFDQLDGFWSRPTRRFTVNPLLPHLGCAAHPRGWPRHGSRLRMEILLSPANVPIRRPDDVPHPRLGGLSPRS